MNLQISPEVRLLGVPNTDPHVRYDWRIIGCLGMIGRYSPGSPWPSFF